MKEYLICQSSSDISIIFIYLKDSTEKTFKLSREIGINIWTWDVLRNSDSLYLIMYSSKNIKLYKMKFPNNKFEITDITGHFPPYLHELRCAEYLEDSPARELYPFRCVGLNKWDYYLYAFNVTMTAPVEMVSIPLLEEMDRFMDYRLEVDFLANGFIRKRPSYMLGGNIMYDLYDFSEEGRK